MVGHPLPENGYAATFAGERKICTSATDNIIEVSTHPSGVGFERGILAVTHSIRKCYALIPELHRILHGKLIPFCTIVQSVPKNAPKAEIADALLTADTINNHRTHNIARCLLRKNRSARYCGFSLRS